MLLRPTVTIVIAVRDRLLLLKRAVESALSQDYERFDVLVVDDGSGPETRDWLDMLAAEDVRINVVHIAHGGIGAARHHGVMCARGDLICVLDSDDQLRPDALTRIVGRFESVDALDLVYTDNWEWDRRKTPRYSGYPEFSTSDAFVRSILFRPRVPFKHSGVTYRRTRALEIGGYRTDLRIKVDIEFMLRLVSSGGKVSLLREGLVDFSRHTSGVSRNRLGGLVVWWRLIDSYGSPSLVVRTLTKAWRSVLEVGKMLAGLAWDRNTRSLELDTLGDGRMASTLEPYRGKAFKP